MLMLAQRQWMGSLARSRGRWGLRCIAQRSATLVKQPQLVPVSQQHREIRQNVADEILGGGIIYLEAGDLMTRNADVHYKYRPHSSFYYLTGYCEPGASCILDTTTGKFTLLLPRVPEDQEIWIGGLPSPDLVADEYGADRVAYTDDLGSILEEHYRGEPIHTLDGMQDVICNTAVDHRGPVLTDSLPLLLSRCRAVKTDAEVACLQEANRVSAAAHMAMWSLCRPGMKEYQLEAEFVRTTMDGGLSQMGYPPIVGAGRNAAVLHYERNSCVVGPQDLVLVDAGAEFRCYTADITRTFPASGTFTAAQRDIYDTTLTMQQAALSVVRPRVPFKDVDAAARAVMLDALLDLGVVRGSLEELLEAKVDRVFMPHGVGHHLGLDVHDAGEGGSPVPGVLKEGHVVTVEPGVYFMELVLRRAAADPKQAALIDFEAVDALRPVGGVRIEDNVVVTAGGHLNLTMEAGCLKRSADIEAFMRESR